MKVFKVWVDSCGYDEYDGAVVVAESKEEVRSHLIHDDIFQRTRFVAKNCECFSFEDYQGEIHIEEVPTDKVAVILTSYNAG